MFGYSIQDENPHSAALLCAAASADPAVARALAGARNGAIVLRLRAAAVQHACKTLLAADEGMHRPLVHTGHPT